MSEALIEVTQESSERLRVRFEAAGKGVANGFRDGISAATIELATIIKRDWLSGQAAKNRTGNLRRAVFSRMENDLTGVVGVDPSAPYAEWINDGSRPHIIEAKNGKRLAFTPGADAIRGSAFASLPVAGLRASLGAGTFGNGGAYVAPNARRISSVLSQNMIFPQRVHHPGTKPQRFMQGALSQSAAHLREIINDRVHRGMQAGV